MFRCPACRSDVDAWGDGPGGRPNARCPHCGALERHRFLSIVLRELHLYISTSQHVVEYAPQPQIRKILHELADPQRYVGIDLMDERFLDAKVDACTLPFADDSFDLMVQFHVLEHIPDDGAAIREMVRVLKPGGVALVQVPYRASVPTDEDPSASEEERVRRFGQADHVRYYGKDFNDRLRDNGFASTYLTAADVIGPKRRERCNILDADPLWICRPA